MASRLAAPAGRLAQSPLCAEQSRFPVCVHCRSTKAFWEDRWAIHYYAPIQGHELVTRCDLIPSELDHPRAGHWQQIFNLARWDTSCRPSSAPAGGGPHIIITTGDRYMNAHEINDLFERESPADRLSGMAGCR